FTYNGVANAPTAVGVYAVSAAFAGDANHEPASNESVSIYINAGPPAPGGVGTYAVTQLGTLGGATSTATAVNASGRVVGYSETAAGETHAFLYDAGVMTDLGTLPGGTFSYATSINDAGAVVGVSGTAGGQSHAFLYSAGVMTDLGTLGGANSFAYDINNLGQIVGESETAGGDSHAFLYSGGTMADLGTLPGGTYSAANALNDAGQLTGYSQTGSGGEHAFLYQAGAMTDLGTLPGDAFSTGSGIDDGGLVVGYSFDPGGATHGFLYDGTVKHDLGVLSDASDFGRALSISDAGAVVGHSTTGAGDSHGFIFDRTTGLRDLNPLLPAAANVTVASANGINSGGQIAGAGDDGSGQTRALLLTPVNSTTTTVASNANPSVYGQTVTFTATVTSAGGTPTGTVQFFDGATSLGTSTLSGGTASVSTSALAVATHNVKATYSGSATFTGSTSPTLAQVVQKAGTATALTSSANPSVYRQPVTFRATVSASAPGAGTVGGAVQFFNGATLLGRVSLSGGVASLTTSALTTGTHNVTAEYRGNANFNVSTSPALAQQVNPAPTVTRLVSSANPSVFGQAVNIRATVSAAPPGGGVPVGSVQFFDGATLLGTRGLTNGSATFGVTTLSVGTHSITARYLGTVNHVASNSGTLSQVVRRASTTTAVTGPTSSTVGQTVTFTAKVTAVAPGAGVPTGTVQFRINGVNAPGGLRTLSAGSATYTTSSLPVGTSTVTAVYSGSTNFNTSSGSLIHRRR
ncbi:MAG TPA: Ig-like domain repeat protein, partial [Pyrinomonadaceae bacterium]|nr:Ig-like domain repeat protein [Pyrinomonadaceae bacterium]